MKESLKYWGLILTVAEEPLCRFSKAARRAWICIMDPEGHTSDNEGVKMALESLFSDPVLEEGLDPGCDKKLNIDDIPETVRPILLDKWQRLRSKLDHARPRASGSSSARNEGKFWLYNLYKY